MNTPAGLAGGRNGVSVRMRMLILATFGVLISSGTVYWLWVRGPDVRASGVARATVELRRTRRAAGKAPPHPEAVLRVASTDPQRIRAFVDVIRGARSASLHKCATVGTVTLWYLDGTSTEVTFTPAHDTSAYEVRIGWPFRVDRARFLDALSGLGVERDLIPL